MSILLVNCFHWVGFHLTLEFLEAGYTVTGKDNLSTAHKEHLSMFVGRNSAFTLIDHLQNDHSYELGFIINPLEHKEQINADRLYYIGKRAIPMDQSSVFIPLPLLFGEWMPMNEEGFYREGKFISFHSETFMKEAVYIRDFTKNVVQCLKDQSSALKLENIEKFRDNRPIKDQLKTVLRHYEQYKKIYKRILA